MRVYDAHELFTEQKEIITRPVIHWFWLQIEKFAVPKFKYGYTVNEFIAEEFYRRYKVRYNVIRNLPWKINSPGNTQSEMGKFIIYQGAVNEGRSFETLIPAMKYVEMKLKIYGKGNYFEQLSQLIVDNNVNGKVELCGSRLPEELKEITPAAYMAVMLFEANGLNQYYSLANRFFDYTMACVPQICVNFPEYKRINDVYNVAYMINDTSEESIVQAIQTLANDKNLYKTLKSNCMKAREDLNWNKEELKLISLYKNWLSPPMVYRGE